MNHRRSLRLPMVELQTKEKTLINQAITVIKTMILTE